MKQIFYLILTVLLLGSMYVTNPNEEKLKAYIQKSRQQEAVEQGGLLGGLKDLVSGPESWLAKMSASRKNYYLLSVYDVKGLEKDKTYLGIFGTFFELSND